MRIVIGQGSCGIAAGAEKVRKALMNTNITFDISITGCIGMCYLEPIVDIYDDKAFVCWRDQIHMDCYAPGETVMLQNTTFEAIYMTLEETPFIDADG